MSTIHNPVLLKEVLDFLRPRSGMVVIDATMGTGGHAIEIIKKLSPDGKLIGIDRDGESLDVAKQRLQGFTPACVFVKDNFCNIDKIMNSLNVKSADGVLLDLGLSSFQLNNPMRGFSFMNEGPLDMRMDRANSISAFDLINNLREEELASILWQFSGERFSRKIARTLIYHRSKSSIATTKGLAQLILKAIPYRKGYRRIHPATRTFQALRIAVNQELQALEIFLEKIGSFMRAKGRLCIISFHSLEDRIVKKSFRALANNTGFKLVVKKPVAAQEEEICNNPRSRSAKLRVLEKI